MVRIVSAAFSLAAMVVPLVNAAAVPPPPPPAWVTVEADLIALEKGTDATAGEQLSYFVADNVRVYLNDKLAADGKADWLRHYGPAPFGRGRILATSGNWQTNDSLMVVEQFDSVDRSKLPPGALASSGNVSRATLYQFGTDHKIHAIRTLVGGGAWSKP